MHFLQSEYWKEIKRELGNQIFEGEGFFFHTTKLPRTPYSVGYMPRVEIKSIDWNNVYELGKTGNCVNIIIDPLNLKDEVKDSVEFLNQKFPNLKFEKGTPVHLQEDIFLDLRKSEDELLSEMKQKHRYNLKLAEKKGVRVEIDSSETSFKTFLKIYKDTIDRQKYFGRSEAYLTTAYDVLKGFANQSGDPESLIQIATAFYEDKPLVSWMLFLYDGTIYYPYGGSSDENKNVMAPYKLVWEICKWGKEHGYKWFDLFGIKKSSADSSQPEYDGYSRFKVGFGGTIIEYADTINLVINPKVHFFSKLAFQIRKKLKFG